jgi:prephenate dehydrogenase
MDAAEHDRWVAASSHLPISGECLNLAVPVEAANLTGPGFASTSRLASSYTPMMLDVLRTNRLNIIDALQNFDPAWMSSNDAWRMRITRRCKPC